MSEKFWIIVVVAVAVLLVVFMLRRQLKSLALKGMGMEAKVQTHATNSGGTSKASAGRRHSVNISNLKLTGSGNELDISRGDVNVERTKLTGIGQKVKVQADKPEQK